MSTVDFLLMWADDLGFSPFAITYVGRGVTFQGIELLRHDAGPINIPKGMQCNHQPSLSECGPDRLRVAIIPPRQRAGGFG